MCWQYFASQQILTHGQPCLSELGRSIIESRQGMHEEGTNLGDAKGLPSLCSGLSSAVGNGHYFHARNGLQLGNVVQLGVAPSTYAPRRTGMLGKDPLLDQSTASKFNWRCLRKGVLSRLAAHCHMLFPRLQ